MVGEENGVVEALWAAPKDRPTALHGEGLTEVYATDAETNAAHNYNPGERRSRQRTTRST